MTVNNTPLSLFEFSNETEANDVYKNWAQKELNSYYNAVMQAEMNEKYIWPNDEIQEIKTEVDITPLKASIFTNYNFMAERTAREQNQNAGFLPLAFPIEEYGDIMGTLDLDLNPFFSLKGDILLDYSPVYHRFNRSSYNVSTQLPFNVTAFYNYSFLYILPPPSSIRAAQTTQDFVQTKQNLAGIEYLPLKWAKFGFQWSYAVDPTAAAVDTSSGRAYGSSYYILLTGFQDCLDIILARNKAAGIPESQATYIVGLNLKIFGFPSGYENIGSYINRSLQN